MDDLIRLRHSEVQAAYRLLFALGAPGQFMKLGSIELGDIKRAYRQRAMAVHPDRHAGLSEAFQRQCAERFIAVQQAYETLKLFVAEKEQGLWTPGRPEPQPSAPPRPREPFRRADFASSRDGSSRIILPGRYLRFGEFLYYSRIIPWRTLIQALVWQTRQRPRLGEIARRWDWLSESQVQVILRSKLPGERLGETLLRQGRLSAFQLKVLLRYQQRLQRPIGQYFLAEGLLTEPEIQRYLMRHSKHNLTYGGGSAP